MGLPKQAGRSRNIMVAVVQEEPDGHAKGFYIADRILRSLEQVDQALLAGLWPTNPSASI